MSENQKKVKGDDLIDAINNFEQLLKESNHLRYQEKQWHIFDKHGNGVVCGDTLYNLISNLGIIDE